MIWPLKGPKLAGSTAGPSMFVICPGTVVSARCVTCGAICHLSIVKTRPFSHVMIILLPNVPTLSNVIALWSELGQPPYYSGPSRKQREGTANGWPGLKDRLA